MRMEIKQLHQRIGSTMVYVTHDQIEAMTMATRIAVMHRGEVQQLADPDTIYNRPANLFVARFMGAPPMNTVPARLEAAGDGLCAVIGAGQPDAVRVRVPMRDRPIGDLVDRAIVLGIRPEAIAEANRRFGDDARDVLSLEAPVELVEPTGAETIVLLRLGGERVLGRVAPDIRLTPGSRARFTIDTRKICLFDPATERLIA
jgi:multiple sugar transport system ATP-binding protein